MSLVSVKDNAVIVPTSILYDANIKPFELEMINTDLLKST
jgi:hypothetical protein